MLSCNFSQLTITEKNIMEVLLDEISKRDFSINQAAELCQCSPSLISKAIKKAGFKGFKNFKHVNKSDYIKESSESNEIKRIKSFLNEFDFTKIDPIINYITSAQQIVLFGYGPSFIVAEYFEYKLRLCKKSYVITAKDEQSAKSILHDKSLLIIFSTTGQFKSFKELTDFAHENNAKTLIFSEEYNSDLLENSDFYLSLTDYQQCSSLKPHEKTRTTFFILIEELIRKISTL